jgi:Spy/CpxP family protein refolding chaperone
MKRSLLSLALAAFLAAPLAAQTPVPDQKWATSFNYYKAAADPLANAFFPPDLVMRHQQTIGLTAEQRSAIVAAIQQTQPRFIEAQWQLEAETSSLSQMVNGARIDQQAVLAQIDRILDLERQIKRAQIELLVRIKNQLTEEQQQRLAREGGMGLTSAFDLDGSLVSGAAGSGLYKTIRRW